MAFDLHTLHPAFQIFLVCPPPPTRAIPGQSLQPHQYLHPRPSSHSNQDRLRLIPTTHCQCQARNSPSICAAASQLQLQLQLQRFNFSPRIAVGSSEVLPKHRPAERASPCVRAWQQRGRRPPARPPAGECAAPRVPSRGAVRQRQRGHHRARGTSRRGWRRCSFASPRCSCSCLSCCRRCRRRRCCCCSCPWASWLYCLRWRSCRPTAGPPPPPSLLHRACAEDGRRIARVLDTPRDCTVKMWRFNICFVNLI